jgi:hypothetical protein
VQPDPRRLLLRQRAGVVRAVRAVSCPRCSALVFFENSDLCRGPARPREPPDRRTSLRPLEISQPEASPSPSTATRRGGRTDGR